MSTRICVPVELDLDVVVDLGQDLDEGERRLAPLLRVERADPDEPMHAALGAQPAVGAPAVDLDRHALEPGLLAFLLVDDLGREAVALGPAEVHPQEHLGPVGRLRAAGAGADRAGSRRARRTRRENSRAVRSRRKSISREAGVALQLGLEARRRPSRRGARARPSRSSARRQRSRHVSISVRRPSASRRTFWADALVVPEPGLLGQRLELGDARFLGLEVKDAPRSTGSVQPGRGWRTRPPSSGPGDPGAGSGAAR